MKRILFLILVLVLVGCATKETTTSNKTTTDNKATTVTSNSTTTIGQTTTLQGTTPKRYGAFLGANRGSLSKILQYDIVSIELGEFNESDIEQVNDEGIEIYAYLSVGSLETYRDYYDEYSSITFLDYDNWPEERWIDVSSTSWQNKIKSIAQELKSDGADGIYMDNVDVYTIAKEHYGENNIKIPAFYTGLKQIINDVAGCGLKVMMNGGSEFLSEVIENDDDVVDSIYAYHQEEVFSLIDDYDNDVFTTQTSDDSNYYKEMIDIAMQEGLIIFLLEYTTDETLIEQIRNYCVDKYYYCSSTVSLT